MWFAPTTTTALLDGVVSGARMAGFTGLLVVLARNADAPAQLAELTREWTSVHDVTGQLIADSRRRAERDRDADELGQIEDELSAIAAESADLQARRQAEPGLAAATGATARRLLGRATADTVDGVAGLTGYAGRVIGPVPETPAERSGDTDSRPPRSAGFGPLWTHPNGG